MDNVNVSVNIKRSMFAHPVGPRGLRAQIGDFRALGVSLLSRQMRVICFKCMFFVMNYFKFGWSFGLVSCLVS